MEVAPDGPVTETHNTLSAQTPICQVTTPKIQKTNTRLVMKSKAEVPLKRPQGAGIAQSVERPTEMPSTILRQVRIPGAARDLSPKDNF